MLKLLMKLGWRSVSGTLMIKEKNGTGINPDVFNNIGGGEWELILRGTPEEILKKVSDIHEQG